jgi:hypothetical protein
VGRLGLLAYLAFLIQRALHGAEPAPLLYVAPLGALAALAMPRREGFFARAMGMALPAALLSFAAVAAVEVAAGGPPWTLPGLFELVLPGLSVLFGVWVGMALTRGLFATLFLVPKLAAIILLLAVLAGALAWRCLEPAPLPFAPAPVTSEEKSRLVAMLSHKEPTLIPEGQTAEVRFTPRDLDLLMAWGSAAGDAGRKTHVAIGRDRSRVEASVRVPRTGRYLNIVAQGRAEIRDGILRLSGDELQVGQLRTPALLLAPLTFLVERGLNGDRRARPLLDAVRLLTVEDGTLHLVYGRAKLRKRLLPDDLVQGDGSRVEDSGTREERIGIEPGT